MEEGGEKIDLNSIYQKYTLRQKEFKRKSLRKENASQLHLAQIHAYVLQHYHMDKVTRKQH